MILHKNCLVCKSSNIKNLTLQEIGYSCCNDCGLVFRNPFVEKDEDPNTLEDSSNFYMKDDLNDEKITNEIKANMGRVELINKYNKHKLYKSIMDIGCGLGFFVKAARDSGYSAFGIELSEKMISFSRSKIKVPIYLCSYDEIYQIKDINKFDVITAFHSLEHIRDQNNFFLSINKSLNKNGLLVIEVPYIFSFESILKGEKFDGISSSHLFYHTPDSLQILLNDNGFKILDILFSISSIYYDNYQSYITKFFHEQVKIDRIARIFTGTSMVIVAKKAGKTREILYKIKKKSYNIDTLFKTLKTKKIEFLKRINPNLLCTKPFDEVYICADSMVYFCCINNRAIGNIKNSSLQEIWFGKDAKTIRDAFLRHDYIGCSAVCPFINNIPKPAESSVQPDIKLKAISYAITNLCNLRCIMCINNSSNSIPIPFEKTVWNNIKDLIKDLDDFLITGGEFFSIPESTDILKFLVESNFDGRFNIITNLHMIKEDDIILLTKLRSSLEISIDSWDNDTYKKIRIPQTLEHFLFKLNVLNRIKTENRSKYPVLTNKFVIMLINHSQLLHAILRAQDHDFSEFQPTMLIYSNNPGYTEFFEGQSLLKPERISELQCVMIQIIDAYNIPNRKIYLNFRHIIAQIIQFLMDNNNDLYNSYGKILNKINQDLLDEIKNKYFK